MSAGNPPARQSKNMPEEKEVQLNYLLCAQVHHMDFPQRRLIQLKSQSPGRFIDFKVVHEDIQPTFKSFKSFIFNNLYVTSNQYPLDKIARHADNEGALLWYYFIQEPSGIEFKRIIYDHPGYFDQFLSSVMDASATTKITVNEPCGDRSLAF
jgi:hypothetical protein